jgi:hypothetical protein
VIHGISELPHTQYREEKPSYNWSNIQHLVFLVSEIDMIKAQIEELKGRVDKLEEHIKSHEGQKHDHSH